MYRANQNGQPQRANTEPIHQNRVNGRQPPPVNIPMTVSEQFRESWLTAIIGLIMFATGMCLLFWNEGRAVKVAHSLDEALRNVAILPNALKLLPEYEGRLIHLSGPLKISEPLTEPDYGVIVSSVKLKRRVQMYQWVEIEEERRTGHHNPKEMPIKSQVQVADEVKIGAFIFGIELKKKFNDFVEVTSDERPERKDIKMHSGLYYHSSNLWKPKVGDIRIQFSYAGKGGDIYSIVGMLQKGTIVPYITSHGEEILLQRRHKMSVDQMFHSEHVHNYWRTWSIRGLGWLVLFLAATCLANILRTVILNSTFLCGIIAVESLTMSVSMSISLLVIGFAWVWYRPVIGLCLALASILPFIYSTLTSASQSQQRDSYRRL
ncbi:transmembrane protein 43 homolog isoform X2 [Apis mellifera]|uniref:Transmembrane protein 43 homolog isoform X2 n=1 Tax=Apis mellifera TaxID=7460 RepID=A0A7M7LR23_APIME|nr:transmembrane protein 43 homolog isoform X2 [Apis mellifera]|eukprot:XP_006562423.1 transmembrane protein 43 homolog isoform X2 [Apis mellifera]